MGRQGPQAFNCYVLVQLLVTVIEQQELSRAGGVERGACAYPLAHHQDSVRAVHHIGALHFHFCLTPQAHSLLTALRQLCQEWPRHIPHIGLFTDQATQARKPQRQRVVLRTGILIDIAVHLQCIKHPHHRAGRHSTFLSNVLQPHRALTAGHNLHNLNGFFNGLIDLG